MWNPPIALSPAEQKIVGRCFKAVDLVSSVEDVCHQFCGRDHDYPSAALSILSRDRHRETWSVA